MTATLSQIDSLLGKLIESQYFLEWLDESNRAFYTNLLYTLCCSKTATPEELEPLGEETAKHHLTIYQLLAVLHKLTPLLDEQQKTALQDRLQKFSKGFIKIVIRISFTPTHLAHHPADNFYNLDEQRLLSAHEDWRQTLFAELDTDDPVQWMNEHIDRCPVLQWLKENRPFTHPDSEQLAAHIYREDIAIHQLGLSLMRSYQKADYYGALLMIMELFSRSYFLQGLIRQLLNNERRISFFIDPLTGLYNRLRLLDDLKTETFTAQYHTLLLINVRHMKEINALYGVDTGDKLLQQLAHVLRKTLKREHLYRLYSDEFIIPLRQDEDPAALLKNLQQDIRATSQKNIVLLGSYGTLVKSSLGALILGMQFNKQQLTTLINADTLPSEALEKTSRNLELEDALYQALAEDRIVPWFQPILNLHTSQLEHYEALMRVVDENGTIIHSPSEFLPVLKSLDIYHEATLSIIHKTFQLMEQVPGHFSINLSTRDIENTKTADQILAYLQNRPDLCQRLTIELLESEAINDYSRTLLFINRLKLLNVRIALDDFGSGYSNFNYLFEMPLDIIKVDGSLITALENPTKKTIVKAILFIAQQLNLKTIAEFVRDEQTLEQVRALGFDYAQGYAVSNPRPAQALIANAAS
ncbi:diguanylate cyclase (GGDEF) domain-containing protein [Sulfurivirga caldicuralii]|uniref:Diguanylate cyclase (GGDEF) domain-containing protein n=1 Tax=Sulfurivirga caldicuralii TaxID=364032 RepID=A0A1N6DNV8_9GAMM|nr:EAL domain-containing protein [Sulfurivirga caldicuralii]SIN72407.1 diguanylate cyclase (GGDEF) domain-containing protein [Sulfurivirga caldicuralii]